MIQRKSETQLDQISSPHEVINIQYKAHHVPRVPPERDQYVSRLVADDMELGYPVRVKCMRANFSVTDALCDTVKIYSFRGGYFLARG